MNISEAVAGMGINQRIPLRKFVRDIRRWVDEGRSDEWIASALGTSSSSVQSFRSRNGIYRKSHDLEVEDTTDYEAYEGVLDTGGGPEDSPGAWFDPCISDGPRWQSRWGAVDRVEVHMSPTRIVLFPRSIDRNSTNGKVRSSRQPTV
ncbi:MAG TPA: hypothetical protein VNA27_06675 [Rubrobacteraceae bacterium]|nr:hypothetical protein [Rubrobacteraceae bacterium]